MSHRRSDNRGVGGANFQDLTANALVATDTNNNPQSVTLANTASNGNNSTISFAGHTLTLGASLDSTASPTFGGATLNGTLNSQAINAGTYSATCGALACSSVNSSGTMSCGTQSMTCGTLRMGASSNQIVATNVSGGTTTLNFQGITSQNPIVNLP